MSIVPATSRDLDGILALELRCFAAHDRFTRATWRHLLGPAARRRTALTLVKHEGGLVVGSVNGLLRASSRILRIYSLAVDPSQRGKGVGRLLVLALIARAPRRCTEVSLEVRVENSSARRLYEALGLLALEVLPAYYPDGGDGVRYRASFARVRAAVRAAARS